MYTHRVSRIYMRAWYVCVCHMHLESEVTRLRVYSVKYRDGSVEIYNTHIYIYIYTARETERWYRESKRERERDREAIFFLRALIHPRIPAPSVLRDRALIPRATPSPGRYTYTFAREPFTSRARVYAYIYTHARRGAGQSACLIGKDPVPASISERCANYLNEPPASCLTSVHIQTLYIHVRASCPRVPLHAYLYIYLQHAYMLSAQERERERESCTWEARISADICITGARMRPTFRNWLRRRRRVASHQPRGRIYALYMCAHIHPRWYMDAILRRMPLIIELGPRTCGAKSVGCVYARDCPRLYVYARSCELFISTDGHIARGKAVVYVQVRGNDVFDSHSYGVRARESDLTVYTCGRISCVF